MNTHDEGTYNYADELNADISYDEMASLAALRRLCRNYPLVTQGIIPSNHENVHAATRILDIIIHKSLYFGRVFSKIHMEDFISGSMESLLPGCLMTEETVERIIHDLEDLKIIKVVRCEGHELLYSIAIQILLEHLRKQYTLMGNSEAPFLSDIQESALEDWNDLKPMHYALYSVADQIEAVFTES